MLSTVALYDALATAPDERARARVIADAFERLEERYPHLPDLTTQGHVREAELRLLKEIEQVRGELRATELRLQKEIEQVRADLKADIEHLRADLKADIEHLRADLTLDIERLRGEVARGKIDLLKWIVPLMFAQVAAIAALVKLL
ncbi:MAG TPA: DUF1640 domain-containing protein [Lamprocystis sp. (in: g-proteobacteria)]|nr:DUF1640 domain-containing protein [Lamprocystis sp. (in: g-proteobacteria)]